MKNTTGIELISNERQEQIKKHGRLIKIDVIENYQKQLAKADSLLSDPFFNEFKIVDSIDSLPDGWDADIWHKMFNKPYKERLIIAGALIVAELDRLIYLENPLNN